MTRKQSKDKNQYLFEGSTFEFSLSKFTGKKVVDVVGFPSDPFGQSPLFDITRIIFEDGTSVHVEGEHDVGYIPADEKLKNMDEETLQGFIEE